MTGQQYTVIADRDKGDDPQVSDLNAGDRATVIVMNDDPACDQVVRIERLVPTADEPKGYDLDDLRAASAQLSARGLDAEALAVQAAIVALDQYCA